MRNAIVLSRKGNGDTGGPNQIALRPYSHFWIGVWLERKRAELRRLNNANDTKRCLPTLETGYRFFANAGCVKISPRVTPLFLLLVFLCPSARAQQTQTQNLPEIDTYVGLTDRIRLMFMAARSEDGNTVNSAQMGPNLDINFRPLLRRKLRTNDSSKRNFLTFRIGYQYLRNLGKPDENRVPLQLTSRFHLPWSMELAERNRIDLRVISGQFSWRYRNRVTIERSFSIKFFSFSPYVRGEVYYDSVRGTWYKDTYSCGATFPIRKRFELEGYYEHENTTGGSPPHINGIGTTFSMYFRRNPS